MEQTTTKRVKVVGTEEYINTLAMEIIPKILSCG